MQRSQVEGGGWVSCSSYPGVKRRYQRLSLDLVDFLGVRWPEYLAMRGLFRRLCGIHYVRVQIFATSRRHMQNAMRIPIAAVAAALLCSAALAADGFLCVAEQAAGIAYNKATKEWAATTFRADENLLITKANTDESKRGAKWMVKKIGSGGPAFFCKEDFDEAGFIQCDGFGRFIFNRRNNRFVSTYVMGYVHDRLGQESFLGEEGANTPAIKAGKCNPL